MKESVKIDKVIVDKVRRESKKRGQSISGFIEVAIAQAIAPKYVIFDNSDAFLEYLSKKGIKYKCLGHETVLLDIKDPLSVGLEWGIYKYQNSPLYKNTREHFNDIANEDFK